MMKRRFRLLVTILVRLVFVPVLLVRSPGALAQASLSEVGEPVATSGVGATIQFNGCDVQPVTPLNAGFEQRVVELVNDYRADKGLPPLKRAVELDSAARYHARDMRDDNYFAHDTYDRIQGNLQIECFWYERVGKTYSNLQELAENIAAGYPRPDDVVRGWLNSEGHRANIESRSNWEIGVGYDEGGGDYFRYWVQDFGRRSGVYPLVINRDYAQTASTSVTLYIYGRGSFDQMRLRNDNDSWGAWQAFSDTLPWRLKSSKGVRTVFVEMRNSKTGASALSSDTIELTSGNHFGVQPSQITFLRNLAKSEILPSSVMLQPMNLGSKDVLQWQVETPVEWVQVSPFTGSTPNDLVQVTIKPETVPNTPGQYTTVLTLRVITPEGVEGSPQNVPLTLTVVEDLPYALFLPAIGR